ncbi:dTMP kinase [Rhodobacteraceae bacterium 63075]|nr:dTMP kinase [Rhodobacteraceae bacterium 63075]
MSRSGARFITLEGVDGSGKSTQAKALKQALEAEGHDVLLTREPGGSPGAEEIRSLVLEGDPQRWSAETEILLFTAARRDHLERTIQPALEAGKIVICDRYVDSTRVYQGLSRGDLREIVDSLHALMIGREADLTLLFDMDPAMGLARAKARKTREERFEDMGLEMQQAMRKGFLELAEAFPARFAVVDAGREIEEIAETCLSLVRARL